MMVYREATYMTELMWDGKYKDGKRVAPVRIALPFQTVETVNESGQVRAHNLDLWSQGRRTEWRNRLIWGDKKYVLPSLLPEFAGKVNLIYIDPPFATGADFSFTTTIPETDESFLKEPSMIEQKAYRDTWGRGQDSYLQWFCEGAILLRELLADDGSIYVHSDWHIDSWVRLVLEEVFGSDNFLNEVAWLYGLGGSSSRYWPRKHDSILWYSKVPDQHKFEASRIPATSQRMKGMDKKAPDYWDIPTINNMAEERLDYPTQKPEALLERIISSSSDEGDLVLDCFCGSGTTAAVAEKLGRRWISCDLGRFAIHTARKRLLDIDNVKPFVVQNLGKYERQAWQVAEFAEGDARQSAAAQLAYRRFMLDLYRAQPIEGYAWLHGVRDGRLVHVGSVEAPVAVGDVQQIVKEFWKVRGQAGSSGVDLLGWEFAFELNEVAAQMAAEANVHLRFKRVPREVLEKKAVEQGDIRFFELAALSTKVSQQDREGIGGAERALGRHVTVALTDFVVPPDDVPEEVQRAVKHWSQWIDYWAVDWDFKGDTFHNMAQTYRTRKDPQLQTHLAHTYEQPGLYMVMVKVIDILGNDTTKTLKVEVR
jgi:adenine-specific DNA-methyltransferase